MQNKANILDAIKTIRLILNTPKNYKLFCPQPSCWIRAHSFKKLFLNYFYNTEEFPLGIYLNTKLGYKLSLPSNITNHYKGKYVFKII